MKFLITCLITMMFSMSAFSQDSLNSKIDYPVYELDSIGQKVVVMTIDQAQKLDNNSELLSLFEKLNIQMGGYDSVCVRVINEKEVVISDQKILISELNSKLDIKDGKIETLQKEVTEYQLKQSLTNNQLINLNDQIKVKDKEIRVIKTKMAVGGGIGGVFIIVLIVLLL